METNNNIQSGLSVILILGWLINKLPIQLTQHFLQYAISAMHKKHPMVFEKLKNDNLTFTIDAIDLPFCFYLNPSKPELIAYYRTEVPTCSATIKGKLLDLLMLFEGEKDGDAMFFSKELIIEGSTAAIVNLRNTIDSEDMNIIEDLVSNNFMFKKFITIMLHKSKIYHAKAQNFLDNLSNAISYNVSQNNKSNLHKINDILLEIDNFKQFIYEYKKQEIRRKSDYKEKNNATK